MNKVAFICPTYPPRYDYSIRLLKSFKEKEICQQADLFFVFSSKSDADSFIDYDNKIVIEDSYNVISKTKAEAVNGKKFYALDTLKNLYRYLITIDDDCVFFQKVNILSICRDFYTKKFLLGNYCESKYTLISRIIDSTYACFVNIDKNLICRSNLYLWFNQMCIYDSYFIDDFFYKIDYYNRRFNWKFEEFEYYIYMHYLVIFHNFLIVDMGYPILGTHSCCEHPITESRNLLPQIRNMIMQCRKSSISALENKNLTLIIHLDRD